jgi:hypothetical protein
MCVRSPAQADAQEIEAAAKRRLADEYDAAQERGEVASGSVRTDIVRNENDVRPATAADLGLSRKDIHEARIIRDADKELSGSESFQTFPDAPSCICCGGTGLEKPQEFAS